MIKTMSGIIGAKLLIVGAGLQTVGTLILVDVHGLLERSLEKSMTIAGVRIIDDVIERKQRLSQRGLGDVRFREA